MIATDKRVAFLKKIHLFHGMDEAHLRAAAEQMVEQSVEAGMTLVEQGTRAETFYIIFEGEFAVNRQLEGGKQRLLATFVGGDYFGEEGLLMRSKRTATVTASKPGLVLRLDREQFNELLRKAPDLRHNLEIAVSSRRLSRRMRFKWVRPGEVIYFLARKHWVVLAQALVMPLIGVLIGGSALAFGLWNQSTIAQLIGGGFLLAMVGLCIWRWLDWGNDYYIVTNRRVVWIEKIIGIYESRQEAPLSTILSVGVETLQIGRIMDFGNVVVRTFVGRIVFTNVIHPKQAGAMVEEHWKRTKEASVADEDVAMRQTLRAKLGLPPLPAAAQKAALEPDQKQAPAVYRPGPLNLFSRNIFSTRFADSETITYRKHWFVLIRQSQVPLAILLLSLIGIGYLVYLLLTNGQAAPVPGALIQNPDTLIKDGLVALALIFVAALLWWGYEYWDWTNDIFQVTPEQIIDIDRTPLGSERRRAAPLENILSTDYQRIGLMGNLFNFGTVRITVGGAQLDFNEVANPATVQSDIDRRRMERLAKKKSAEQAAERDRMAEWLATYHRSAGELRDLERLKPPDPE